MKAVGSQLQADEHFKRFDAEAYLIGRLGNPSHIVDGKTDYASRKPLIAAEILHRELHNRPIEEGRSETYAQVYQRLYGESLSSTTQSEKTACSP